MHFLPVLSLMLSSRVMTCQEQTWFWHIYFRRNVCKTPSCVLCTVHPNATQTGTGNFRVRKIPNCPSTVCTGWCATIKTGPSSLVDKRIIRKIRQDKNLIQDIFSCQVHNSLKKFWKSWSLKRPALATVVEFLSGHKECKSSLVSVKQSDVQYNLKKHCRAFPSIS